MAVDFWQGYVVTGFLTALTTLSVGLFVYFKNRQSAVHKAFMLLALAIFQWSLCTAVQGMQTVLAPALFWGRVCHIGVLFIPVLFYYFTLRVTTSPLDKLLIVGYWVAGLFCIAMLSTPYFIPTERTDAGVNFIVQAGPGYSVIIVFFVFYVCASLLRFHQSIKRSVGARKKHLEYFFWSSVVGYGIGVINFFPAYGITFPPFPYSAACGAIYFWIIGYAILKHKLFDIEVFVKKGLVFSALFVTVYGVVSGVIYLAGVVTLGASKSWMPPFSIALAMLIYEPLKFFLERVTHKFLFQKKRPAVLRIQSLSAELRLEIGQGGIDRDKITSVIAGEMGLKNSAFYEYVDGELVRVSFFGITAEKKFGGDHPFSLFALNASRPMMITPLSFEKRNTLEDALGCCDGEALVPIKSEKEVWGLLLLGAKQSDEPYSVDDEAVLHFLQNELAMLFLSSKLLTESVRSGLELSQRAKMASLKHLARGVHHEVRNPLHTIALMASATVDEIKKGNMRGVSVVDWLPSERERIRSMQEEIRRIRDSLGRFAQFARPGTEEPKELLLCEQVSKFLALMREGHKLDEIKVQMDIAEGIKILAAESVVQETLFSLFMNSFEAMAGKGQVEMVSFESGNDTICLSIKDSGPGILASILPRIFEAHFTTKADTGAVGISLSAMKHRLERLGGRIEVRSEPGQGAEFRLYFKSAT